MIHEILETNQDGSPSLTRTRILITRSLNNSSLVNKYVGQEAWLYEQDIKIWVATEDGQNLILLPYKSEENPGEYIIIE